jgi:hypothetical protein
VRDLPVAEALVERDRGRIRHRGLELHQAHAGGAEPALELGEELPAHPVPPGRGRHVERDHVAGGAALAPAEHEGDEAPVALGHDRLRPRPREEGAQRGARVGDAGRKAGLVERPQRLEIIRAGVAQASAVHGPAGLRA